MILNSCTLYKTKATDVRTLISVRVECIAMQIMCCFCTHKSFDGTMLMQQKVSSSQHAAVLIVNALCIILTAAFCFIRCSYALQWCTHDTSKRFIMLLNFCLKCAKPSVEIVSFVWGYNVLILFFHYCDQLF